MSKEQSQKEKVSEAAETAAEEKVLTKYDLKMQRRLEEKERAAREKRIGTAVTIVVLVALVCLVLSFPIRTLITLNRTFISVGGENLTQVEFDYCYYTVANNYINNYSAYLSYFGLDPSQDLGKQTYMGEMTWKDYFEEMAVDSIKRNKSLKADGKAAGFEYDTARDYERFVEQQKKAAQAAGVSLSNYLKQLFGPYATEKRIRPYVEEALYVSAYYEKLSKDMTPGAQEVEAAYAQDPASYDSVNYRILQFDAVLPDAPTELADPDAEPLAEGETYKPSDAEIEKAMSEAKAEAEAAMKDIRAKGDLVENMKRSSTNSAIRDWLFDDERKAGSKAVLEDSYSNRYYCVEFAKRYRDEEPTADIRVMLGQNEEEMLGIYGTWKSGAATEESFEDLCNGQYYDYAVAEGGLIRGMSRSEDLYEELVEWIFADNRRGGDCEVITVPDVASFVVYYIGEGNPQWYSTIESNLMNEALEKYVDALKENCALSDPSGNLKYIKIHEAEEAAAAEKEAAESASGESSAE